MISKYGFSSKLIRKTKNSKKMIIFADKIVSQSYIFYSFIILIYQTI